METPRPRPRFASTGTIIAIIASTVPGLLQALPFASPWERVALVALVGGALLLSTVGLSRAERASSYRPLVTVMVAYGATVAATLWVSRGYAFLVAMPLASMVVLYFPLRVAVAVELCLAGLLVALMWKVVPDTRALLGAAAAVLASLAFVFVFSLLARRERYARQDLERLNREVAELATARERTRIAREIHDALGHCLTAASVQLEAAQVSEEVSRERLARVQALLRQGLQELRGVVTLLREPGAPTGPFSVGLEGLVAQSHANGLSAGLSTHGEVRGLPSEIGLALYRVTQEALTNVQRHARASKVEVQLHFLPQRVCLRVLDDGVGGSPTAGHGLKGLEERVVQLGGTVVFDSPPAGGFQLTVELPA